jgi:hypothetical protein
MIGSFRARPTGERLRAVGSSAKTRCPSPLWRSSGDTVSPAACEKPLSIPSSTKVSIHAVRSLHLVRSDTCEALLVYGPLSRRSS